MPSTTLPKFGIQGEWGRGDDDWDAGVNANWRIIDSLLHLGADGVVASLPATGSFQGQTYILSGTGQIAVWVSSSWNQYPPQKGMTSYDSATGDLLFYNGTSWQSLATSIASVVTVADTTVSTAMLSNPALFYTEQTTILADMVSGETNVAVDAASLSVAINSSLSPASAAGAPTGAPTGTSPFYTDSGTGDVYYWTGTAWQLISNSAAQDTVVTSAGAADAGKLVESDANGLIDSSLLPVGLPTAGFGPYADAATYLAANGGGVATVGDAFYNTTSGMPEIWNGTAWEPFGQDTIASLTDTTIAAPALNQVLQWNGSAWVNATLPAATTYTASNANIGGGIGVYDATTGSNFDMRGVRGRNGIASNLDATNKEINVEQDFNSLTDIGAGNIDPANDFLVVYDTSAAAYLKVKPEEIGGGDVVPAYANDAAADTGLAPLAVGKVYYDSTTNQLKAYNGTAWVAVGGGDVLPAYANDAAANAGLTEVAGSAYYDTTLNVMKLYDGTTWNLVQGEDNTVTIAGAAPGVAGQLVYNNAGTWTLADGSDLTGAASATHMISEVALGEFKIQQSGPVTITGHGFTVGDQYFQHVTTAGGVQAARPVVGEVIQTAFDVIDANTIELNLQNEARIENPNPVNRKSSSARMPADQAIGNNAFSALAMGSTFEDTLGYVNLATNKFEIPAGVATRQYKIFASIHVELGAVTANDYATAAVFLNGAEITPVQRGNYVDTVSIGGSNEFSITIDAIVTAGAGDEIDVRPFVLSAASRVVAANRTYFRIEEL